MNFHASADDAQIIHLGVASYDRPDLEDHQFSPNLPGMFRCWTNFRDLLQLTI